MAGSGPAMTVSGERSHRLRHLAQPELLDLAGRGLRQFGEYDVACSARPDTMAHVTFAERHNEQRQRER